MSNTSDLHRLEKARESYTQEEWIQLRVKAKTDLLYLAQSVLMPPDPEIVGSRSDYPVFLHLFSWMKRHETSRNKLILMPRSHRKTTYCTSLDALQIALPDDLKICPHPRNLGPNVRLGIVHETLEMAQKILQDIKNWVDGNDTLKFLFPEIIPDDRRMKDNASQFELKRGRQWKEASLKLLL